jgi:hypothetical protein
MSRIYYTKGKYDIPLEAVYEAFYTPLLLARILGHLELPDPEVTALNLPPTVKINYAEKTRNLTGSADTSKTIERTVEERAEPFLKKAEWKPAAAAKPLYVKVLTTVVPPASEQSLMVIVCATFPQSRKQWIAENADRSVVAPKSNRANCPVVKAAAGVHCMELVPSTRVVLAAPVMFAANVQPVVASQFESNW